MKAYKYIKLKTQFAWLTLKLCIKTAGNTITLCAVPWFRVKIMAHLKYLNGTLDTSDMLYWLITHWHK